MKRRFEKLVDTHGPRVLQLARLMLRSSAEAEDVAQETLIKLWGRLESLDAGGELPWLISCARNACLDRLRRDHRRTGLLRQVHATETGIDDQNGPEQMAGRAERERELKRALAGMPEPGRSLLILRDIQEIDVATVARTLSLSENQVKVYTFRARRALRRRLEEEVHEQVA